MHECLKLRICLLSILGVLVISGCQTVERPVPEPAYVPRPVLEIQRFELSHDGRLVGAAVLMEIRDPAGALRFWRFLDRNGAVLGHSTEQGRFSRRVPFLDREEDLGIWPMAQGIGQLLDVDGEVGLRELPVAVPASASRGDR